MRKYAITAVLGFAASVTMATSANAVEFAVFNPEPSATGGVVNFSEDSSGHLTSISTSTPTVFTFDLTPLSDFGDLASTFNFSATESSAAVNFGGVIVAPFAGSFDYTYSGPTVTQGGVTLTTGELLLHGDFTDATFLAVNSASGGGLTDDSIIGTVTYTSGLSATDLPLATTGESFTLGFIDVTPVVALQSSLLREFEAVGDGKFSSDLTGGGGGIGTPEPATWALTLVGVGGIGLALRRRNRVAASLS